jgi:anti-sigma factor RsiW
VPALNLAGTGLAGALAGVALTLLVTGSHSARNDVLTDSVIDSHIRSLMGDHLLDVQTSDQHTVKPFLSAHLPVSPPVPELAQQGFPLVGGRLDYIDGHPAAAVVYRHDKHIINLFAWASPDAAGESFHTTQRQGFNVVTWRREGMTYAAVSDVEAAELAKFAGDIAK